MTELYNPGEADALRRRARAGTILAAGSLLAGLVVCVALCTGVTTLNALARQWTTVAASTLAGWIAILSAGLAAVPSARLAQHTEWMLSGEREAVCGTLTLDPMRVQIPRSIAIRKVRVNDGTRETVLNVNEAKAAKLPTDGRRVRVECVRRYIVAWEACDEEA